MRGEQLAELSPKMIHYWWKVLNAAVFKNKLPKIASVTFVKHRAVHAWAIPHKNGTIKLSIQPKFDTRRLFLMVLVHEMVHAWEHYNNYHMAHGKRFFMWKDRIEQATTLELKEIPDECTTTDT